MADLARTLRLLTYGGLVIGGTACTAILGAGPATPITAALLAAATETTASVAGSVFANAWDSWWSAMPKRRESLKEFLDNEKALTQIVGLAIARIIDNAASSPQHSSYRDALAKLANKAERNWPQLARKQISSSLAGLNEAELTQIFAVKPPFQDREDWLPILYQLCDSAAVRLKQGEKIYEWNSQTGQLAEKAEIAPAGNYGLLAMYCPGDPTLELQLSVMAGVAADLQEYFPKVLQTILTEDFAAGGRAFADLSLKMFADIKKTIGSQEKNILAQISAGNREVIEKLAKLTGKPIATPEHIWKLRVYMSYEFETFRGQLDRIPQYSAPELADLIARGVRSSVEEINYSLTEIKTEIIEEFGEVKESVQLLRIGVNQIQDNLESRRYSTFAPSSEVEPLPDTVSAKEILKSLLQLDLRSQSKLVKQVTSSHRTASFLIHGDLSCGQDMLVRRLCRLKSNWCSPPPIEIPMSSRNAGLSLPTLWQQLPEHFELPKGAKPKQIRERICEFWQERDVILIFQAADRMRPKDLSQWLREFWQPLVEEAESRLARTQSATQPKSHLLMFLVDYCGSVSQSSEVAIAQEFSESAYPRIPLKLALPEQFESKHIENWLDSATINLGERMPAGLDAAKLLAESENGIPEKVYERICEYFKVDWGEVAKCQI